MGVTQRQTEQLQPRRLREWVPGFSLLQQNQTSTFSSSTSQTPITTTVELEKTVNQSLLDLHKVAGDKGDGHLCDFLESEYLGEQVEGIKAIGDLITKMKRAGDGLGLHLIDKEMGS